MKDIYYWEYKWKIIYWPENLLPFRPEYITTNKHRKNISASKRYSNANGYNARSYFRKLRDKVVSEIKKNKNKNWH